MRLCLVDDVPFERQVFSGLSKLFKSTSRSAGFRYGFVCLPLPVCTCLCISRWRLCPWHSSGRFCSCIYFLLSGDWTGICYLFLVDIQKKSWRTQNQSSFRFWKVHRLKTGTWPLLSQLHKFKGLVLLIDFCCKIIPIFFVCFRLCYAQATAQIEFPVCEVPLISLLSALVWSICENP